MNLSDIQRLFDYDAWANALIFDCIDSLTGEQYMRPLNSSFPTIRETIAHVVGVEWIWNRRLHGDSPTEIPPWMNEATPASLRAKLKEVADERAQFLTSVGDLDAPISFRDLAGNPYTQKLADVLQHVVNHSTYHRGQLTTMIRQVGVTPPRTDFIVFVRT
jgi:uncharacterized damage-inducible protein DinB